jgi:hypothetical protein
VSECSNPVHSRRAMLQWSNPVVEHAIWLGVLLGRAGCSCVNILGQFSDPQSLRVRRSNEEVTAEVIEPQALAAMRIVAASETFTFLGCKPPSQVDV